MIQSTLIILTSLVFTLNAWAIQGPLLHDSETPPQLCQIVPTAPARMHNGNNVCSAIIISPKHLLTAGHCAYKSYVKGRVDCYGGEFNYSFLRHKIQFPNKDNVVNPLLKVQSGEQIYQDIAVIEIEETFKTKPLPLATAKYQGQVFQAMAEGKCKYAGVGYNQVAPYGLAHSARAPKLDLAKYNGGNLPLAIEGTPHITGHDSGGGFVCPIGANGQEILVGTLVAENRVHNKSISIVADYLNQENLNWVYKAIDGIWKNAIAKNKVYKLEICDSNQTENSGTGLFANALEHLSHFSSVRHALMKLFEQGLSYCATGLPLEKDIYKNFRYFSQIEVRDREGQLKYLIPTLYLSPSVQADHNVGKKPWTAIDYEDMAPHLKAIADEFTAVKSETNVELTQPSEVIAFAKNEAWWDKDAEDTFQVMTLGEFDGAEYFVGGWIANQNPTATLYAQYYAPKMVVYKYDRQSQSLEWSSPSSAYTSLLVPAGEMLEKAAKEEPKEATKKVDYFLELGAL